MRVFYGVYLQDDKSPMALFIREDWAIDFQRRMNKKNPAVTLYVRPTQRAVDLLEIAALQTESTPEVNPVGGADITPPANH